MFGLLSIHPGQSLEETDFYSKYFFCQDALLSISLSKVLVPAFQLCSGVDRIHIAVCINEGEGREKKGQQPDSNRWK